MVRKATSRFAWLVLAASLLPGSCTEVIDIELDSTYRRLVVYGTVTTDSIRHQVRLTTSSDYFSNEPSPKITGALVELEFDGRKVRMDAIDTLEGLYQSPGAFRGVPGTTYTLHISGVDVDKDGISESYSASSTMPGIPLLDSIVLSYFRSPFVSGYQVFMYALDPPSRNYYGFRLLKNGQPLTERLFDYTVQTDDFFNGSYIFGLPVGFLSDDDPDEAVVPGDTVTFELNSIDRAFYDFVVDAQLEILGNNPLFSGPPANVRSNINNNGKGIFAAYAIHRVSSVVPVQ